MTVIATDAPLAGPDTDARPPVRAFVGLGANLGDPLAVIRGALAALGAAPATRLVAVSSLYRSAPVDAQGPDFLNAVAELETRLAPRALLEVLLALERHHRRERPYRNAPRTLDLDLLLHGDSRLDTAELQLPHPRMHTRAFVLAPLSEIDPNVPSPGRAPLAELLRACGGQRIEPVIGPHELLAQDGTR